MAIFHDELDKYISYFGSSPEGLAIIKEMFKDSPELFRQITAEIEKLPKVESAKDLLPKKPTGTMGVRG